jgi:hypothetical protein
MHQASAGEAMTALSASQTVLCTVSIMDGLRWI